ncbi:MAG: stage IV sporulation protein A [Firmicutes bacterium]|nr:stage IV sporulation protein A [Bacillota bacterium]MDD4263769.1 stage IV sporulation protein A [Bacillota bacterium]MDD4693101.1 stage IV sporulation protein A [Bacillota bacterium]
MEATAVFKDIVARTRGDIYIGVVGPVRTGKSTFIKRFVDLMVLPLIKDEQLRKRTRDELPQSGSGKMIMTTEPKFVPDEAVTVELQEGMKASLRLVDCVGYTVSGALGYFNDEGLRLVRTPWNEEEISFEKAAEIGTRKVIQDHSNIGLVVTTDGSITDLPRDNYLDAEERVVRELKELGKPFIVLLNSMTPNNENTITLAQELSARYEVSVVPVDCLHLTESQIGDILSSLLFEFPLREIAVDLPEWVSELPFDHELRETFEEAIFENVAGITKAKQVGWSKEKLLADIVELESVVTTDLDLGQGRARIQLNVKAKVFYDILEEITGFIVEDEASLFSLLIELGSSKKEYDKVAIAMQEVRNKGYGIVKPGKDDIVLESPEAIKQGSRFGIRLKASAPSYHIIKADIYAEVTPFVGTERQGEEFVSQLESDFAADPGAIWEKDFLGKSLSDMMLGGIEGKLYRMPFNAQEKLQETLERIINDGSGGLICIIF